MPKFSLVDLADRGGGSSLGENERNDETVETQGFTENKNKNHTNVKGRLLTDGTNTGITNNTDGETSSKRGDTTSQTGGQVGETSKAGVFVFTRDRGVD